MTWKELEDKVLKEASHFWDGPDYSPMEQAEIFLQHFQEYLAHRDQALVEAFKELYEQSNRINAEHFSRTKQGNVYYIAQSNAYKNAMRLVKQQGKI